MESILFSSPPKSAMQNQLNRHSANQISSRDVLRLTVCLVFCTLFLGNFTGCVRRRMTINSNPQGAMVYVDGHQIGKTPVSTDFTYYGTRNIRLELENHQTLNVKQKITPPWYQFPPFEFFAETCTPADIKDDRIWTYDLQQKTATSDEQVLERAKNFSYEGSRSVNEDGSLGPPITSENFHLKDGSPSNGTTPNGSDPNAGASTIQQEPPKEVPQTPADPNAFPTGSADWDTPYRYPQNIPPKTH